MSQLRPGLCDYALFSAICYDTPISLSHLLGARVYVSIYLRFFTMPSQCTGISVLCEAARGSRLHTAPGGDL